MLNTIKLRYGGKTNEKGDYVDDVTNETEVGILNRIYGGEAVC